MKRVIIALFFVISIFFSIIVVMYKYFNKESTTNNSNKPNTNEIIEEEKYKEYSISLVMVGDSLIHDKIYNEAKKYGNNQTYDFKTMLSLIKPIIASCDLAYYNQETILGGSEIGVSSYPAFNSPYEVGDAMIDTSFNLVSLATNHTLDRGNIGILKKIFLRLVVIGMRQVEIKFR